MQNFAVTNDTEGMAAGMTPSLSVPTIPLRKRARSSRRTVVVRKNLPAPGEHPLAFRGQSDEVMIADHEACLEILFGIAADNVGCATLLASAARAKWRSRARVTK